MTLQIHTHSLNINWPLIKSQRREYGFSCFLEGVPLEASSFQWLQNLIPLLTLSPSCLHLVLVATEHS